MIRFSTDIYPETERLDGWQEEFARRVIKADVSRLDRPQNGLFHASLNAFELGQVFFTDYTGTPACFSRDKKQAADGDDSFTFLLNRRGSIGLRQKDTILHKKSDVIFVDHGRPFDVLTVPGAPQSHRIYGFAIPRNLLRAAAPGAEERAGRAIQTNPAILEYLMLYTDEMLKAGGVADNPVLAQSMGAHLSDLLALLVGPDKDTIELASRRGLRAARLKAILSYIEHNLDSPDLNGDAIAHRHAISRRYVSQLMEEQGETFSEYVLRRRLDRVAAMLSDPATRHMRISEIAYACGFSGLSYFNRAFRRRFGESPRSYRA